MQDLTPVPLQVVRTLPDLRWQGLKFKRVSDPGDLDRTPVLLLFSWLIELLEFGDVFLKSYKDQQTTFAFSYFLVCFLLGLAALLSGSVFWIYSLVFIVGLGCLLFAPEWRGRQRDKMYEASQEDCEWSGGYYLDRSHQIKQLRYILNKVSVDSSVVVGVSGAWGSGKTTLINKVINIKGKTICRFSPWASFEGKDFIYRFIDELISSIGNDKSIKIKGRIKVKWKLYRFAIDVANLPKRSGYREYVAISTVVAGGVILLLQIFGENEGLKINDATSLGVFFTVVAFIYAASFINGTRGKGHAIFSRSAEFIFKEICKDVLEEKIELVVLIDDVDRVDADDFYNLIRVMKFVSLIPMGVFIIVYDEEELKRKLEEKNIVNIKGYMDKLVDYVVDVPMLNRDEVSSVVIKSLGAEFSGFPDKYFYESEAFLPRYIDFLDALSIIVDNPRTARKIANDIRLSFECGDIEDFELLDPIDFIAVKAIKASNKIVYRWMKERHSFIVAGEVNEKEIDKTLSGVSSDDGATKKMLSILYPSSKALWGSDVSLSEDERAWSIKRNRLFAQKDPSPYFDFSMNEEVKASSYVSRLMTNALEGLADSQLEAETLRDNFEESFVYEVLKKISSYDYPSARVRLFAFLMCCDIGSFASHKMRNFLGIGLYERAVFSLRDIWVNEKEFVDELASNLKYYHIPFFDFVRFDVAISRKLIKTNRRAVIDDGFSSELIEIINNFVLIFLDNLKSKNQMAKSVFDFGGSTLYLVVETLMRDYLDRFIETIKNDVVLLSVYIDSANTGKISSYGREDHYQSNLIDPVVSKEDIKEFVSKFDGNSDFSVAIDKLNRYLSFLDRDEPF